MHAPLIVHALHVRFTSKYVSTDLLAAVFPKVKGKRV